MRSEQRLRRLELVEQERQVHREAERLAEKLGLSVDEVVREYWELTDRVARWGWDAEIRRLADELGLSEEETRARYDEVCAEVEAEREAEREAEGA
jgi:DNA-binding Lrp family transcriptional regulator